MTVMVSTHMAKILMTTIQVNFVLIPSETDLNCCYFKILLQTDHHSQFLAATWISLLFYPCVELKDLATPFFNSLNGCF